MSIIYIYIYKSENSPNFYECCFQFEPPNMDEVSRLFAGKVMADHLNDLKASLTFSDLIDSSMHGILVFHFILNWIPTCVLHYALNPILSMFTKDRLFRE